MGAIIKMSGIVNTLFSLLREQLKTEFQISEGSKRREKMEQRHKKEAEEIGRRLEEAEKSSNPSKRLSMVEKTINKKVSKLLSQQEKEKAKTRKIREKAMKKQVDRAVKKERRIWEKEFEKQQKQQEKRERAKWLKEIRLEKARRKRLDRKRGVFEAQAKEVSSAHNRQFRKYFIKNEILNLGTVRFLENAEPAVKKLSVPTMKEKLKLEITFQRLDAGVVVEEVDNL